MREWPILTTELTLQLERCVVPKEKAADVRGNEVVRFGRTIACKTIKGWPPSRVFGFNGDDVGRLKEILDFFGEIDPTFYLSHAGFSPEVGRALCDAGFQMDDWEQTILYGLPMAETMPLPAGTAIELVTRETIEIAAEVAAEGNGWDAEWRENAKNGVRVLMDREHLKLFLARCDGEPAGIGHLKRSEAAEKWGWLGGGAVIPRFRRRGIHTALLAHRLHIAYGLGYEMVGSGAIFDTPSFRNQQRLGMRLGYIETAWKRMR